MGLPTGAEGRDSSKGEDSAEESDGKPAVVAPPPVVEAVSNPSSVFPSDATTEVSHLVGARDGAACRVGARNDLLPEQSR